MTVTLLAPRTANEQVRAMVRAVSDWEDRQPPRLSSLATAAPPRIIGFAGPIGAGKTAAADHLCRAHGFARIRFAGPLKDMMRAIGLSDREVDGDLKETPSALLCGRTPRHAMQTLGTEWGRELIAPDLWTTLWSHRARRGGTPVVADDVRFGNEVAAIHALDGIIVRIERPGCTASGHASETQAIDVDLTIVNDGSLEAFLAEVDRLV